ncbi:hypothetical protein BH11PSE5_BH11PSE5_31140 [soil metagenome]
MIRGAVLIVAMLLCGCQSKDLPAGDNPAIAGLERAGIETGVVADATKIPPVGLFQRRSDMGKDLLCIVPGKANAYRFGLEVQLGANEYCAGSGTARRTNDKLILNFSQGARCIAVAQYDGDRVVMPGVMDMKCADMCAGKGTIEGVDLPRLASGASSARAARDRSNAPLCP